jgi:large subunit ribosomal protein L17
MRHLHGHKKLNRPTDQRLALLKGLAKSLIEHGEITTSQAKAKSLVRYMQKLVKLAKKGDVSSLRLIRQQIDNRNLIRKLKDEIVPKLSDDPGGEVSMFKAGRRRGDGAEIAIVAFNFTD